MVVHHGDMDNNETSFLCFCEHCLDAHKHILNSQFFLIIMVLLILKKSLKNCEHLLI